MQLQYKRLKEGISILTRAVCVSMCPRCSQQCEVMYGRWRWLDCCVRCVWCECTVERPVETWRGLPASIARARWPWTLQMPQRGRALSLLVPRAQSWRGRAIKAPNNPPPKRAFCTYRMIVELNSTLRLRATAADDVLISIATPYGHTGRALRVRRA